MEENNKEKKGQSVRVLALVLGILAVFVVFGAQLVNWQLVHGAQYRAQADKIGRASCRERVSSPV